MNADNRDRILKQFYKFCTRLLKNERCDIYRRHNGRQKRKNNVAVIPLAEVSQTAIYDNYFEYDNTFCIDNQSVEITDNRVASAIRKLPKDKQDIIILSYFLRMTDTEIAKRRKLTQQTICKHRNQTLMLLQNLLQQEDCENE